MIKTHTTEDIQAIIQQIEAGNFSRRDIKLLFIELRPYLTNTNPLKDISDFVAHPDKRDKGNTFMHLNKFINEFISVSKYGGQFTVKPVSGFSQDEIIENLIKCLVRYKFKLKKQLIINQSHKLMRYILEIIEDTSIELGNSNVVNCKLSKIEIIDGNETVMFCFNIIDVKNGTIYFRNNVTMCVPAFQI